MHGGNASWGAVTIPPDLSLISVDIYAGYAPGGHGSDEVSQVRAQYEHGLLPKLADRQRAIIVPGLFGCSNLSWFPAAEQSRILVEKLDLFWTWAVSETRIGGFCPWHYADRHGTQVGPADRCDMTLGAEHFPQVAAKMAHIGATIVNNSRRLKTDESGASSRQVDWWWSGEDTNASDPAVEGLLSFCKQHRSIVTTVMMRCGVVTCCRTGTGDCGNAVGHRTGGCTNNGGVGGTISGELSAGCKHAIPELVQMGIRPEIWLGEDDSLQSARYLLSHPNLTTAKLLAVADANPGIAGFQIDLETKAAVTSAEVSQFTAFLRDTTATLHRRPKPLRFSAAVGCNLAGEGGGPLGSRCKLQASSGVDKLYDMSTYYASSYADWYPRLQATVAMVPLGALGLGLLADPFVVHAKVGQTNWTASPDLLICAAMNASVQTIGMYDLRTTGPEPLPSPQSFWLKPLEKFMRGGGCDAKAPVVRVCPNASNVGTGPAAAWRRADDGWPWVPPDVHDCCESNANRGPGWPACSASCAKTECESTTGMTWIPQNNSVHPYLCCRKKSLKTDESAVRSARHNTVARADCWHPTDANANSACLQATILSGDPENAVAVDRQHLHRCVLPLRRPLGQLHATRRERYLHAAERRGSLQDYPGSRGRELLDAAARCDLPARHEPRRLRERYQDRLRARLPDRGAPRLLLRTQRRSDPDLLCKESDACWVRRVAEHVEGGL